MSMNENEHRYYVQSPWTNKNEGKLYPLTEVTFTIVEDVYVPFKDTFGISIVCEVTLWNTKVSRGLATWCKEDGVEFNPRKGCRMALDRAINPRYSTFSLSKEMRTAIWGGFIKLFGV